MRHPSDGRCHFSELRQMAKSPAHFALACKQARDMTRPMIVGAIADCMVFGQRGYACYPGPVRRGKDWELWRAENMGLIHCIGSEEDEARGAADAVIVDPVSGPLLRVADAEFQTCAQWQAYGLHMAAGIPGERGGFDLVGTLDEGAVAALASDDPRVRVGATFLNDLKVTSCTEPYALSVHAWKMLWHAQLACYSDGIEASGGRVDVQLLTAVEAQPPHNVTVLVVPIEMIEDGRKSCAMWAERVRACDKTGKWPGYVTRAETMVKPAWEEE